jgi:hypothetical protein
MEGLSNRRGVPGVRGEEISSKGGICPLSVVSCPLADSASAAGYRSLAVLRGLTFKRNKFRAPNSEGGI